MTAASTLFLRLEGPLQAWGGNSKFVIRRTQEAPTKSGVLGLICCAMGVRRREANESPISRAGLRSLSEGLIPDPDQRTILRLLNTLAMGVRIDRPGTLWQDYHTVGAKIGILRADGEGPKKTSGTGEKETLITRRYYLCDASFLVALQGDPELVRDVYDALSQPKWPVYLGRKSCPPSVPVLMVPRDGETWANPTSCCEDLEAALALVPWQKRMQNDTRPASLDCVLEWRPSDADPTAPPNAEAWHDQPYSFDPPGHHPRLVIWTELSAGQNGDVTTPSQPAQYHTPAPPRSRANYRDAAYRNAREKRLKSDHHLCVFCKAPCEGKAATVQHITYRRAGGDEDIEDLRSLCRLCHDAVTMIEYGLGMGLDRINPEELRWRNRITEKREEIIQFRSLGIRRRRLEPQEVE